MSEMIEPVRLQCRYLRPNGVQCRHVATRGHHYCYHHDRHGSPRYISQPRPLSLPLLDDRSAIQVAVTDIARAALIGTISPAVTGRLLWAMQIATTLLPKASKDTPLEEPVEEVVLTEEGEELAPEQPYYGPNGKPEQKWDFSKWLYVARIKRKGIAAVTPEEVAETDFPPEGYLTAEEIADPEQLTQKIHEQDQADTEAWNKYRIANPPPERWRIEPVQQTGQIGKIEAREERLSLIDHTYV
jgi:hypothetical protein